MAEATEFENVRTSSNFQLLVTLTITLDRIAYHCASLIDLYLYTKFNLNLKNFFCERLTHVWIEPQAVAVSPYGWLMTHYGWLAGLSRLAVVSTAAA